MSIGILYESKEWSSYALRDNIIHMGIAVKFIDAQEEINENELLSCDLILNRVFASAVFRGHHKSHTQMPHVIKLLQQRNIPMINPPEAHFYEISKEYSTKTLAAHGFPVPKVYGVYTPAQMTDSEGIEYPCVVKPDCGGRTNYTFIIKSYQELTECMKNAPDIQFIAEEYIYPEYGYVTRIEVIGRACKLMLKRSVSSNGLSAYHLGSAYAAYPELPCKIKHSAISVMDLLHIEAGSMDIIENSGGFYFIDINSVSNASEDNTEMFNFDLMWETAAYAVKKYKGLKLKNGRR